MKKINKCQSLDEHYGCAIFFDLGLKEQKGE